MKTTHKLFFTLCLQIFILFWVKAQTTILVKEAEDATLVGVSIQNNVGGYSGTGFVNMQSTGSISFTVNITTTGFYKLTMRVSTPYGHKSQDLYLDESKLSTLNFPGANASFFDYNAGNLYLTAGNHSIEIKPSWGYMNFDKFTLTTVEPHDYSQVVPNLINSNSNIKTKLLYDFIRSTYGNKIIAGQTAYWDELIALAGKTPVIRAFDFQHYTVGYAYKWNNQTNSHSFGWEDDGVVNSAIDWYNSTEGKGIVTFQWHWHSPSGGIAGNNTFYTDKTTFDVTKAVVSGTPENIAIVRDIDSIATQLKKLEKSGIPVLFRPLHEAGGAWFWWGAKGSKACLALYDILYDRITNHHGINNLIWVWSTPEKDWYPGNAKVDILGYDSYPGSYVYATQKSVFDQLFDIVEGKKIIAMTENGPIPDIDKCFTEDAKWAYFSSWSDLVNSQNTQPHIEAVYAHEKVITLEKMNTITSIEKPSEVSSSAINIYPNPATNKLNFQNIPSKNLEIWNVNGKKVANMVVDHSNGSIDISALEKGVYLLIIKGEKKYQKVFIKE